MKIVSRGVIVLVLLAALVVEASAQSTFAYKRAVSYASPVVIKAQADFAHLKYVKGKAPVVAYMPPATEFNYYIAIGEGIKAIAKDMGASTFMLAPQSGADINGQMGMIQDVITRNVDAIILSTHDEHAAAPLVKQAIDKGIEVIIVNSDILDFPTPVQGVVGYSQRHGTQKEGHYAQKLMGNKQVIVGIIEGQPGYHSTERCGGFIDVISKLSNFKIVASLPGDWNVEGGNRAGMDLLQAHPDINLIFAANDYEIMGAQKAASGLGKKNLVLMGNDGDTACLEEINAGNVTSTVNTTPFVMGQIALQVALDGLYGNFKGGFVETPTTIVDKSNAITFLKKPENLFPKPSKAY
ncbi:MAG TPA: sugar ABC transporter substrate-binding protein [Spirochaetia bacterium]|nr:sugar ABC transporter substrate-binding protein [Spirochaetia bacterium]